LWGHDPKFVRFIKHKKLFALCAFVINLLVINVKGGNTLVENSFPVNTRIHGFARSANGVRDRRRVRRKRDSREMMMKRTTSFRNEASVEILIGVVLVNSTENTAGWHDKVTHVHGVPTTRLTRP
jgi:hypothetical protein